MDDEKHECVWREIAYLMREVHELSKRVDDISRALKYIIICIARRNEIEEEEAERGKEEDEEAESI